MELTGQLLGITDLPHGQQLLTFKTAGGLYQLATGIQDYHTGIVDLIDQNLTVTVIQAVRPSESGQTLVVDTLGSLIYYGLDTRHFSDGRKAPTQAPTVLLFLTFSLSFCTSKYDIIDV